MVRPRLSRSCSYGNTTIASPSSCLAKYTLIVGRMVCKGLKENMTVHSEEDFMKAKAAQFKLEAEAARNRTPQWFVPLIASGSASVESEANGKSNVNNIQVAQQLSRPLQHTTLIQVGTHRCTRSKWCVSLTSRPQNIAQAFLITSESPE
jgi:hypothetical protein